ncbi:MAG: hypothetical protein QW699_05305, partial [Metallosphaera sp.]
GKYIAKLKEKIKTRPTRYNPNNIKDWSIEKRYRLLLYFFISLYNLLYTLSLLFDVSLFIL